MDDQRVLILKDIPSQFITYEVKELKIRALTLGEMLYLSSKDLSPRALGELMQKCVLNFDFLKLINQDAKFVTAYAGFFTDPSRMYNYVNTCKNKECGEQVTKVVSAENFFESEDIEFDYPLDVDSNGHKYTFGFYTFEDKIWLDELKDKEKYDELVLYPSLYLRQIDDKDLTRDEAYKAIYEWSDPDSQDILLEVIDNLKLKFKDVEIKCKKCGQTHSYPVDLEVSTLLPFQKSEGSVRNRIKGRKRM